MKEYGIYTNDKFLLIITEINQDYIQGVKYLLENFVELNNKKINETLYLFWDSMMGTNVVYDTFVEFSKYYDDIAYLGQINSRKLQKELKDYAEYNYMPF